MVYSLFSLFFGQNGLYARKHLEAEYLRLLENRTMLENTKQDILKTKNNLMFDKDAKSVYARQLGYGRANERFIRITGLTVALTVDIPEGQVLYAANPDYVSDKAIKIISALFGLVILVYFLIGDFFWLKEMDTYPFSASFPT
ncbi:MAG: septum formation initiator family protein [Treponema sp.]|nr:septum formation initiator family protein [Treponema sp.]